MSIDDAPHWSVRFCLNHFRGFRLEYFDTSRKNSTPRTVLVPTFIAQIFEADFLATEDRALSLCRSGEIVAISATTEWLRGNVDLVEGLDFVPNFEHLDILQS